MLKNKMMYAICSLSFLLFAGCSAKSDITAMRNTEFQRLFPDGEIAALSAEEAFAVAENGEFYLSEEFERLCRYSADGTLLDTYENVKNAKVLCLMGEQLFFYTYEDELKQLSLKDRKVTTLAECMLVSDVQNLVAAGENLYALVTTSESGQIENVLKEINVRNGRQKTIETEQGEPSAVYASAEGKLYYCTKTDGGASLYLYDEKTEKSTLQYDLSGYMQEGQTVQCFVYEKGLFVCSPLTGKLTVLSLGEEKSAQVPIGGNVSLGRDMVCVAGNVISKSYVTEKAEDSFYTVYLGEVVTENPVMALEGTITVCGSGINVTAIEAASGLKTKFVSNKAGSTEEFLAELMAGNPEIDFYLLTMSSDKAWQIKEKGIYEPLNSSNIIENYADSCFSYIADGMRTESGDIWMLPIGVTTNCIFYVEENLGKYGISTEDFQTMDSFLALSERLTKALSDSEYHAYVNMPATFALELQDQYDIFYCDFKNGTVNYKTKEFRDYFETLYQGWVMYSQNPKHPILRSGREDATSGMAWEQPEYDLEHILYKWTNLGGHLNYGTLEGWRLLPSPVFSEKVQGSKVTVYGLILNPYSAQKELAMSYLETIAKNPMEICTQKEYVPFLFKDWSRYEGVYDTTLPAVQDLYRLFADGYLATISYPYTLDVVADYQADRLTIEEAVDRLQKETEMWLGE